MEIYFDEERPTLPHAQFMKAAFREAEKALQNDEVPIGAVVVFDGQIIGRGFNQIELLQDPTAHAEILAISAAAEIRKTWRLNECTLYVTLEPCMMCLGAIMQSRIERIVYAASDNRFGAIESSVYRETAEEAYKRWPEVVGAVMADESREMIQHFFKGIRQKNKALKQQRRAEEQAMENSDTSLSS